MNRLIYIVNKKHAIGIIMGVITAFVILGTQTFYYDYAVKNQVEIPTEDGEEHQILTVSQDAVSTVVDYTLNQVLHFISKIYTEGAQVFNDVVEETTDFNAYFKMLFRLIISPNAP